MIFQIIESDLTVTFAASLITLGFTHYIPWTIACSTVQGPPSCAVGSIHSYRLSLGLQVGFCLTSEN